jgi:geranylgeranyl pyrophosphate synthase
LVTDISDYETKIGEFLKQLLEQNGQQFDTSPLVQAGRYALSTSGKMLRGKLLMKACESVGGNAASVIPAAAGIEYGHLASLIHDDLIDGDDVRRNKDAVWRKYGANQAVLSGDLFIFHAYQSFALCKNIHPDRLIQSIEKLSKAYIHLAMGQALEAEVTANRQFSRSHYMDVIRFKTSILVKVAVEIGGILGGASKEQLNVLSLYGEKIGLVYQIIDDLLPYISDEQSAGKSPLSDLKNKRITLPLIHSMELSTPYDQKRLLEILEMDWSIQPIGEIFQEVKELLIRTRSIEHTYMEAHSLYKSALKELTILPDNEGKLFLTSIAHFIMNRKS